MSDHLPSTRWTRWKKFGMKLLLLAASSLFCLAVLECVLLARAGYERKTDGPPRDGDGCFFAPLSFKIEPDLITGYRQSQGKIRFAAIHQGELLFDNWFVTNSKGYISNHEFTPKKAPGKKRIAVMGDSFTAQWHSDAGVCWPEQMERRLNLGSAGSYEVYNFALNGVGLQNWHSIFFKELVPTYEFDAVVFAVWIDDLVRTFVMASSADGFYWARYPRPPLSLDEFHATVAEHFLGKVRGFAPIVSDEKLSQLIAERNRWEWPGLKFRTGEGIASIVKGVKAKVEMRFPWRYDLDHFTGHAPVTRGDVESFYAHHFQDAKEAKEAIGKLYLMMDYCKAKNVPVVLCNVPTREGAMEFSRRRKQGIQGTNLIQRQLQSVARDYGCLYFDGYGVFGDISPEAIRDEYWLKVDEHWRRRASDLFAERLAEFLERHWQKDDI